MTRLGGGRNCTQKPGFFGKAGLLTGRESAPARGLRRAAFTITECLVALVLLGAAAALLAQLVAAVGVQRRVAEQHSLALQETANLMERLFAVPYAELTTQRVAELQLSEAARQRLPDARLAIGVSAAAAEPAGKEIRISLHWLDRSGRHTAPLELTAWRYEMRRDGT